MSCSPVEDQTIRYELFLRGDGPLPEGRANPLRVFEEDGEQEGLLFEACRDAEGRLLGIDIAVAPDETAAAKRLCECAFELAEAHVLNVYDPQLGCLVERGDQALIEQRLLQTARYTKSLELGMTTAQLRSRRPNLLVWYVVAGLILLVVAIGRIFRCVI
jgi:hypothetical protein